MGKIAQLKLPSQEFPDGGLSCLALRTMPGNRALHRKIFSFIAEIAGSYTRFSRNFMSRRRLNAARAFGNIGTRGSNPQFLRTVAPGTWVTHNSGKSLEMVEMSDIKP
jgi:hypothetical protein